MMQKPMTAEELAEMKTSAESEFERHQPPHDHLIYGRKILRLVAEVERLNREVDHEKFEARMWLEVFKADYRGRKARETGVSKETNPWYLKPEEWGISDLMEADPNIEAWEAGWDYQDALQDRAEKAEAALAALLEMVFFSGFDTLEELVEDRHEWKLCTIRLNEEVKAKDAGKAIIDRMEKLEKVAKFGYIVCVNNCRWCEEEKDCTAVNCPTHDFFQALKVIGKNPKVAIDGKEG